MAFSRWYLRVLVLLAMVIVLGSSSMLFLLFWFYENPYEIWSDRIWLSSYPNGAAHPHEHQAFSGEDPTTIAPGKALEDKLDPWDSSFFVKGAPTANFRDTLREDTSYITTWSSAGYTNQFIGYANLIYLSMLAERVPVIPSFAPDEHISKEAGVIPFGKIFNLTHLRSALQMPILEWSDIKSLPSSTHPEAYAPSSIDKLGCWSTRPEDSSEPISAFNLINHLGLDVSYTRVPEFTRQNAQRADENHIVFAKLVATIHSRGAMVQSNPLPLMKESSTGSKLGPDERLTCLDTLYYMTSGADYYEWRFPWSPAWRFVGRHIKFNDYLVERAEGYLRRGFRLRDETPSIPKFIAVHVRRGDFGRTCNLPGHCLSSLDPFVEAVTRIRRRLLDEKNIVVSRILVASDETNSEFWKQVSSLGWYYIDHEAERTMEIFGEWYAPLVDVVIQSLASGFVGTEDSTFSLVSGRRVEDWNNGCYTLVGG